MKWSWHILIVLSAGMIWSAESGRLKRVISANKAQATDCLLLWPLPLPDLHTL